MSVLDLGRDKTSETPGLGYSYREIIDALSGDCDALALRLFGQPESKRKQEWRWRRGGFKLTRTGRHRGMFRDYRELRSYSPIGAAALALGMSYEDAARWAALDFLRWPDLSGRTYTAAEKTAHEKARGDAEAERRKRQTEAEAQQAADEAKRIEDAMALWRRAVPIEATPAAVYLRSRAIKAETWPETLRWHPSKRLLLALSTSPEGDATAVQEIHLDDAGKPVKREDGSKIKLTRGVLRGGAVKFPGKADGPVVICEGVETGRSVHWATGFEVWIGLGIIANVSVEAVPHDRTIIACPDDDARDAKTILAAKKAIRRWRAEGRKVLWVSPFDTLERGKGDHNDALVRHGPDYVARRFNAALHATVSRTGAATVEQGRDELAEAIQRAMHRLVDETIRMSITGSTSNDALQIGIRVDVGGGKTREAVAAMVRAIARLRAEMPGGVPAVVYSVPTHRLGAELEQRILAEAEAQGIRVTVRTWRGREAMDPETGSAMCGNLEAVKAAQKALLKPQEAVCESRRGQCPLLASCRYQGQRKATADVWLVPHAALFHERPEAIGQPALLIVDEGLWQSSLRGFDVVRTAVGFGNLMRPPKVLKENTVGDPVLDPFGTADLHEGRKLLLVALKNMQKGPVNISALLDAGVTEALCRQASGLEWKRLAGGGLRPGMDPEAFRRKAVELAEAQGDIRKLATMWRLLGEAIDGGAEAAGRVCLEMVKDASGAEHEALVLRWTASIAEGWNAPTLHIDATLRPDLVRHIFPRLEMAADIRLETPHQRTVAVTGKSFSHAALTDEKAVLRVWQAVRLRAAMTPGETLVILPKRAEDIIRAAGPVPDHIHVLHHNATQGLDRFGKVALLIVVGRTMPPPGVVSHMAAAITGQPVEDIGTADGWYRVEMATVPAKDGSAVTLPRESHLPGLPEEIRRAICEDQLLQAIGRGRGVNRTAADPLEVEVWSDAAPPVEVDAFRLYEAPTKDEAAVAAGIWAESAADLSALHPSLGTANAIKAARKRLGSLSNNTYHWETTPTSQQPEGQEEMTAQAQQFLMAGPHLRFAAYKKAGPGMRPGVMIWDSRTCPDPQAALSAAVGPLALWAEIRWPARPDTHHPAPAPEAVAPVRSVAQLVEHRAPPPGPPPEPLTKPAASLPGLGLPPPPSPHRPAFSGFAGRRTVALGAVSASVLTAGLAPRSPPPLVKAETVTGRRP
jgi:putative DNA primase/helicase